MRRWEDSTFVFISTNQTHHPDGVEERWLPVMQALAEKGAGVRFLALMHSPMGEWARTLPGIEVDPYILDKWNVIRARSRLRKYLKRYVPVVAHSTGIEADLLLRWAARKVPVVHVAHTLTEDRQGTRRRRPIDALFRRFDEIGMSSADAVFVGNEKLAEEVRRAGVARVLLDPVGSGDATRGVDSGMERGDEGSGVNGGATAASVRLHLDAYRTFMAERGNR